MMRARWVSAVFGMIVAALPLSAFAEFNTDLRVKLGGAAGVERVEFSNGLTGTADQESGGNFQVELVLTQKEAGPAAFVGSLGVFGRQHAGNVADPVLPTKIEYDAGGLSGSAGISIRSSENLHFEVRYELGLGSGEPTFTSPGFIWNDVREGGYVSSSLLLGAYFTASHPGVQIGLELGVQSFVGEFQIWNNAGYWADGEVRGSGGIANLVIGYRF